MPAHDEALLIESCVQSLRQIRYPESAYRVVVMADNCTDDTAQLALASGAQCLVRTEPSQPGKPHAIAWALSQLTLAEYDAVVIVDADTVVDGEFASELARAAPLVDKAVQGYNGVSNPDDSNVTRMAAVFADAKCLYAYELKARAGLNLPIRLGGCIGTGVLEKHGWNAFSIGEDWELYALLTIAGVPIVSAPGARVYAQEAKSLRQSASQRRRWAAGKFTVLGRVAEAALRSANIGAHQKLDVIAELTAPGPVVHLGLVVALSAVLLVAQPPAWVGLSRCSLSACCARGVHNHRARDAGKTAPCRVGVPVPSRLQFVAATRGVLGAPDARRQAMDSDGASLALHSRYNRS